MASRIGDHIFKWEEITWDEIVGEQDAGTMTVFYHGTITNTYRKYVMFSPKITKEEDKVAFSIPFSIRDPSLTNDQVRGCIQREYDRWIALKKRAETLARGELF